MAKNDAATDALPDEVFKPERWLYAGVREHSGKRMHAWVTDLGTGQERYWPGSGQFVIGGYYTAMAARTTEDDGKVRVVKRGDPEYAGTYTDMETRRRFAAEDTAAKAVLAGQALERKHAKDGDMMAAALRPLMRMSKALRSGSERAAFIAYVTAELGRARYMSDSELAD